MLVAIYVSSGIASALVASCAALRARSYHRHTEPGDSGWLKLLHWLEARRCWARRSATSSANRRWANSCACSRANDEEDRQISRNRRRAGIPDQARSRRGGRRRRRDPRRHAGILALALEAESHAASSSISPAPRRRSPGPRPRAAGRKRRLPRRPRLVRSCAHPAAARHRSGAGPLAPRLSHRALHRAVFEPASERGKSGIDELQQQTVSLLSFQQIPKEIFAAQVSFNMLAKLGEEAASSCRTWKTASTGIWQRCWIAPRLACRCRLSGSFRLPSSTATAFRSGSNSKTRRTSISLEEALSGDWIDVRSRRCRTARQRGRRRTERHRGRRHHARSQQWQCGLALGGCRQSSPARGDGGADRAGRRL